MSTKNCTRSVDLVQYKLQPHKASGFLVGLVEKQKTKNDLVQGRCTDEVDIFVQALYRPLVQKKIHTAQLRYVTMTVTSLPASWYYLRRTGIPVRSFLTRGHR
eukprot:SAG11_NODE_27352_length_333_cov_2.978632_1_plen_103_part_10